MLALSRACVAVDPDKIDQIVGSLVWVQHRGGRVFVIGVGGSAANASHMVNDLRKLCGFEAYAPTDNVAELTARTNDDGWETVFENWLVVSRLRSDDCLFVLSVGGGTDLVSKCIRRAVKFARARRASILSIVGQPDGTAALLADISIRIEAPPEWVTPITEAMQAAIWHAIVNHPVLKCA